MDEHLIEKFLAGSVTEEEAEEVLDWFGTDEGQLWLSDRFDRDVRATWRKMGVLADLDPVVSGQESANSYKKHIYRTTQNQPVSTRSSAPKWLTAAAVVFLAVTLSLMEYFHTDHNVPDESVSSIEYMTGSDEHRVITLSDGTRIRMNENSVIELPQSWQSESRTVHLQGEAFFEVSADSLRPFIVKAEGGEVHVLGTAFSVKTATRSGDMIVAVSEGRVSLGSRSESPDSYRLLEKNMLGLLNLKTHEVTAERRDVTNYINWMHDRIVFHSTPFDEVLRQLSHIYDIRNEIGNEELLQLKLTADFSERSMDNALETIAHSLGIEVEREGHSVTWKANDIK